MTTIACNMKEMAADTKVSCEGIGTDVYSSLKLFTAHGSIYGVHGEDCSGQIRGIEWLQQGAIPDNRPDPPAEADWHILALTPRGIAIYNTWMEKDPLLERCIAVGSGRKVALYCMKFLGMSPAQAVYEACKADDWTDTPIYVASLADPVPRRWTPAKKKRKA